MYDVAFRKMEILHFFKEEKSVCKQIIEASQFSKWYSYNIKLNVILPI